MNKNLVTAAATAGLLFTAFGASASAQENTYTVQPGDSLWKIAKLNNVSVDNLKAWNQLSNDRIYVNQKLSTTYTVKSGDSLWAIARSQGTTVNELKNANGLTTDLIQIGQQLKIPVPSVTVSAPAPTTYNNPTSYVVQKGDSLSVIGARYNVSVSELKSINQLTSNQILVGEILKLRSARAAAIKAAAASTSTTEGTAATTASQPAVNATTTVTSQEAEKTAVPANSKPAANTQETSNAQPTVKTEAPASSQAAVTPAAPQTTVKPAAPASSPAAVSPAAQPAVKPAAPAASQPATTQAAAASNAQAIITEAKRYIGAPYLWGGNTPSGFDCSGFVKYVFAKFGVSLPRTTETQWSATTPVSSPNVGDLVFFQTYKVGPSHVGIYLGNNQFISAASSGVTISNLTSSYWKTRYLGARKAF